MFRPRQVDVLRSRVVSGLSGATDYAYGWFLLDDRGHRVASHPGRTSGFAACVAWYPDDHLYAAILSNDQDAPACATVLELAAAVLP